MLPTLTMSYVKLLTLSGADSCGGNANTTMMMKLLTVSFTRQCSAVVCSLLLSIGWVPAGMQWQRGMCCTCLC